MRAREQQFMLITNELGFSARDGGHGVVSAVVTEPREGRRSGDQLCIYVADEPARTSEVQPTECPTKSRQHLGLTRTTSNRHYSNR